MLIVARCFPSEMSKTGQYTNVVCCEVKILCSEQNPRPECSAKFFLGRTPCGPSFFLVSIFSQALLPGPLSRG